MDSSANVNAGKFTPLHSAAYRDHADFAKLLLSYKANLNAVTDGGMTPLHEAVAQGSPELIEVLIDNGADVNARDKEGVTALTLAFGNTSGRSTCFSSTAPSLNPLAMICGRPDVFLPSLIDEKA